MKLSSSIFAVLTFAITCVAAAPGREESANEPAAGDGPEVARRLSDLEKRYHIRISRDGQSVKHGNAYAVVFAQESTWAMRTRTPTLGELDELTKALEVSEPSQLLGKKPDSRGIAIYFLLDAGEHEAFADWGLDGDGHPALFVEPFVAHYIERWKKDPLLEGVSPLQAIFVHELAHNSAFRMGYDNLQPDRWKEMKALGWVPRYNGRTRELEYLIRSKEDEDTYYKFNGRLKSFIRCDRSGHPVTSRGIVTAHSSEAELVPVRKIAELAAVPPATYYCFDPMEVYAEAMMAYRLGGRPRSLLEAKSPILFQEVRDQDQNEIDMTYGKSRFYRGEDGRLTGRP